ncbi:FSIP1 family-domain-containing protein [Paraphysoderma sedebokerense]|nr:FSIP1 family-domain-containing protein [Paraphysoderma sedebokerense]
MSVRTVPKTPMIPERVVHCKTPNKLEQLPIEEPEPMISYVEVQPASRPDNLAVTDIEEESTQRSPEQQEIGNSISVQPIAAASEDDSTRMAKPFKLDTNDPKIIAALEEIKNCDYILETKFQLLKKLARQSKEMESINGTHIKLDKEIEKELKSKRKDVLTMLSRSQNFDHVNDATFLTEATFEKELSTGLASDQSDSKNHQEYKSNGSRTTPSMPKNFKKGDFIQRNIVLGADARFFSAMSEDEEKRVERVLEIDFDDASYSCSIGSPETRPVSVLSGFTPEPEDLEKLNSIHSRLQQIIPPLEWDSKSTALSTHEHSVGSQTPRSSVWSTSSDLHSVDWQKGSSNDISFHFDDLR